MYLTLRTVNYALIGIVVLAIAMISLFVFQQSQPEQESTELPVPKQPSFALGDYGETVSLEEAERDVGYQIRLPSYLPENNTLRMIKIDEETNWSFLIYSPVEVSDQMMEKDLIDNNGVIITNFPAPEVRDVETEIERLIELGGRRTQMDDHVGVGFDNIPLMPGYSEIHWWEDGVHRIVGANYDFEQLARIIESIPEE